MYLINVFDANGTLIMQSYVPNFPGMCKVSIVAMPPQPPSRQDWDRIKKDKKRKGLHRG